MNKNKWIEQFDRIILNSSTRELYDQEPFFNVGYWSEDTDNQQQACLDLMEKLLAFIPDKQGKILDVGCGLGATTNYLSKYYDPKNIIGINISPQQLEQAKIYAPNCQFILMDAVKMAFEDNSFQNIICVEAAFYFDTREDFLREARRVLKPGGKLIMADMFFATTEYLGGDILIPQVNIINSLEDYKDLYQQAGFESVELLEVTEECWFKHFRYMQTWLDEDLQAGKINEQEYDFNVKAIEGLLSTSVNNYCLVCATKVGRQN